MTEMVRRSPLVRNSILPSWVAKIVSSRPTPVPGPGRKRVPRWRTMIIPAFTSWPANIFTPSIFGLESRPLREEPSPFLCAICVRLLRRGGLLRCSRLGRGLRRRLRLRLSRRRLRRRLRLFRRGGLGLRRSCRSSRLLADRRDLDLREPRAMAVVALVARPLLVLADPDLLAEDMLDDRRGHLHALRCELGLPVAAYEQHFRVEGLLLVHANAVHEKPLALLDAVLLSAE